MHSIRSTSRCTHCTAAYSAFVSSDLCMYFFVCNVCTLCNNVSPLYSKRAAKLQKTARITEPPVAAQSPSLQTQNLTNLPAFLHVACTSSPAACGVSTARCFFFFLPFLAPPSSSSTSMANSSPKSSPLTG